MTSRRADHLGASTYLEQGWSRLALGDPEGAVPAFREVLCRVPDHQEATVLLAWALAEQGAVDEADELLEGMPPQGETVALAPVVRGIICLRRGRVEEARTVVASVSALTTDARAAIYAPLVLGMASARLGQRSDAHAAFIQAVTRGPNCAQAWYERGWLEWEAGEVDAARASWRMGGRSGRFSRWGGRCLAVLQAIEAGREPERAG